MFESCWAFAQGELQASEQWAAQLLEVGTTSGQPDAGPIFGAEVFLVRDLQGRLLELVEPIEQLARGPESAAAWRAIAAIALFESGQVDEAHELACSEDFKSVPWDWNWQLAMFNWARACSRLDLGDRAGELYELLEPFSSQLAASGAFVIGSIAWGPRRSRRHPGAL